jgi:hypothetical protein
MLGDYDEYRSSRHICLRTIVSQTLCGRCRRTGQLVADGLHGHLTLVEIVLIRQRSVPFQGEKRRGRKRVKACSAPASPGRIETDGSRAAKGILARFQRHTRSRGVPAVSLGWLWNNPFTLQGIGASAGDGMPGSATRAGFRA